MKKISSTFILLLALALFASACGGDDVIEAASGPDGTSTDVADGADATSGDDATSDQDGNGNEEGDMNESIERLWIGPELVDCIGEAQQKCMLIRRTADGQVEYFYDGIEGFTHEAGTTYVIDVAVTDVENPPADGSSLQYRLVEIVESSNESATAGLDGTSWTLLGFRDGDLFDAIADDVEITINFDGDQANGSSGCNNYVGTFTADGDTITFGPLASTRMMCPPQIMAFEDRFLPLISTVETAEMTFDGTLVLTPAAGMTLVFAPATAS